MEELKTYSVQIHGCDDSTIFDMEMTEKEHEFLQRVLKLANETSYYCCMPSMDLTEKQ